MLGLWCYGFVGFNVWYGAWTIEWILCRAFRYPIQSCSLNIVLSPIPGRGVDLVCCIGVHYENYVMKRIKIEGFI